MKLGPRALSNYLKTFADFLVHEFRIHGSDPQVNRVSDIHKWYFDGVSPFCLQSVENYRRESLSQLSSVFCNLVIPRTFWTLSLYQSGP